MHDKACNIAKNLKYNRYQKGFASMVYIFFDKKSSGGTVKNENISNKELAEELHKPNFKKEKYNDLYRQYLGHRSSRYAIDKQI